MTSATPKPTLRIVHRRHWGPWVFAVLVLLMLALLLKAAIQAKVKAAVDSIK